MRFYDICREREGFTRVLSDMLGRDAAEDAEMLLDSLSPLAEEGHEVALTVAGECLLVRIYDDGYAFPYPSPLTDTADTEAALTDLSLYMRRELLAPVFTDVPREELDTLGTVFHRVSAAAYEDDEDSFFVRALSECEDFFLASPVCGERVSLSELDLSDAMALFEIATDTELNKFWGYDYREDRPDPDLGYFLRVAEGERGAGVAMSLAIRLEGEMIGEAVLFDFDYRGSAQAAIRLKPAYHGHGYGREALGLLISVAENMGLTSLRAEVMLENTPSLAMTRRYFDELGADGDKACFTRSLS